MDNVGEVAVELSMLLWGEVEVDIDIFNCELDNGCGWG